MGLFREGIEAYKILPTRYVDYGKLQKKLAIRGAIYFFAGSGSALIGATIGMITAITTESKMLEPHDYLFNLSHTPFLSAITLITFGMGYALSGAAHLVLAETLSMRNNMRKKNY